MELTQDSFLQLFLISPIWTPHYQMEICGLHPSKEDTWLQTLQSPWNNIPWRRREPPLRSCSLSCQYFIQPTSNTPVSTVRRSILFITTSVRKLIWFAIHSCWRRQRRWSENNPSIKLPSRYISATAHHQLRVWLPELLPGLRRHAKSHPLQ